MISTHRRTAPAPGHPAETRAVTHARRPNRAREYHALPADSSTAR